MDWERNINEDVFFLYISQVGLSRLVRSLADVILISSSIISCFFRKRLTDFPNCPCWFRTPTGTLFDHPAQGRINENIKLSGVDPVLVFSSDKDCKGFDSSVANLIKL
ncbi:hypothetical protein D3C75_1105600 [compost metagenome]